MRNVKEVLVKIQNIENTKKITKAMEMVASRKMLKTQQRMKHTIPYAQKILEVISHVARGQAEYRHPYMEVRPVHAVGYIIVTTDRGLCAGLNTNLLKVTLKHIKQQTEHNISTHFCIIGNKGAAFLSAWVEIC